MRTIDVTEKETTTNEELYLAIKNRETDSIIDQLLAERYGWAFENANQISGYVWAERASGNGKYIIHYNIYNFPVEKLNTSFEFDFEEFKEDIENDNHERYTSDTFDGIIEKISID